MSLDANASGIPLIDEEDSPLNSSINTTPLVDIMLVMLIIFLITVPVVVSAVEVALPEEENRVVVTRPENLIIVVDKDGTVYLGTQRVSEEVLNQRLREAAVQNPQPAEHDRRHLHTQNLTVGKVDEAAQPAGILRDGFITTAPPRD
jgi:biopolymer transport protein ExbD